jgi:hypothetical protein
MMIGDTGCRFTKKEEHLSKDRLNQKKLNGFIQKSFALETKSLNSSMMELAQTIASKESLVIAG